MRDWPVAEGTEGAPGHRPPPRLRHAAGSGLRQVANRIFQRAIMRDVASSFSLGWPPIGIGRKQRAAGREQGTENSWQVAAGRGNGERITKRRARSAVRREPAIRTGTPRKHGRAARRVAGGRRIETMPS